ncbi:cytochrome c maturation protein CcmE [Sphingomonas sp. ASY06-1R]|jgi:cytochrome c-type biogenesis protein CcmE|uniref:cytochrome c maturation protein CcmE n=1 Tax=Sphingomonas sp. ASY06-1R TaxID=3445771 RepID=UPI003FA1AA9A
MKAKNQRLTLAIVAVVAVIGAGLLAMAALKDQAAYFYTPGDVMRDHVQPGAAVRLGGMVQKGSLKRLADGVTILFVVTDNQASVPVRFSGIVPALFREGSGVVADGRFDGDGQFRADTILAKHDERYMPPQVAKSLEGDSVHKSESLKK